MAEKLTRWQKFKRFLKRNMTPTWAMHFSYQVFAFIVAVAMIMGVATYAFTKSYDEIKLTFVDGFTITAHSGAYDTQANSMEFVKKAIEEGVDAIELDIRQRPNGTVVMGHDIIPSNTNGTELKSVFEVVRDSKIMINLDIKEIRLLPALHDLIVEYSMIDRVFLTGIEEWNAKDVVEKCPNVEFYINYIPSRIKIFSADYQQKLIDMLVKTGACGINCNHANASRTLSEVLHDNGYKLSVWTVDKDYHMKRALVNRPDNITTNYPDDLKKTIKNWGKG
ncbi:MAG: glycerophosphodiester phosphodiesterase [Eubacterium sp.]|nr:glycerophosphodiester phosphodiesterase [Eubacterium sp.]